MTIKKISIIFNDDDDDNDNDPHQGSKLMPVRWPAAAKLFDGLTEIGVGGQYISV